MASMDEQILRAAKEIAVKFIEAGRVSPSGFRETFHAIYRTVTEAVNGDVDASGKTPPPDV